jgi:hypothetical protein
MLLPLDTSERYLIGIVLLNGPDNSDRLDIKAYWQDTNCCASLEVRRQYNYTGYHIYLYRMPYTYISLE